MDPLSSLGKVRTMEQDLTAVRNNARVLPDPRIQKKTPNMVNPEIKVPIEPVATSKTNIPGKATPTPQASTPKKEFPTAPTLPPRPAMPSPAAPPLPRRETKLEISAPKPSPSVLGNLSPRPVAPPPPPAERPKPLPPVAPPPKRDIAHLLPIEEEMPATELKKSVLPSAPTPSGVPSAVESQRKTSIGMTPEEILGIRPPASPAGGFPPSSPKPPVAPRVGASVVPPQPPRQFPVPPTPPVYKSSYGEKRGIPFGLATGIIGVLVVALGGFGLWQLAHRPAAQNQPPPPVVINPPTPFFAPDSTTVITVDQGRENLLIEQIRTLEHTPGSPQSLTYIPIKKSSDGTFMQTKEFLSTIGVSLPKELLDDMDSQFMLYLYTPGSEEQTRCVTDATEKITDTSCYSPRLGIVFKINSGQETAVTNIMSGLEPTLLQAFTPIILGNPSFASATPWDTATYKDISVRFSNLPISTTSLNWAKINSYLVVATSKNSSYSVLDKFVTPAVGQ